MNYNELMIQSLSDLLENNETLKFPIYGTLIQKNKHWFGFLGLTDNHLLIALLDKKSRNVCWTNRVPLDIKTAIIKKSLIPLQYKVHLEFNEGLPCDIQVSKKVYGIKTQETNFSDFIKFIQEKQLPPC